MFKKISFLLIFFGLKIKLQHFPVMACHVITLIWLHKPSVKSLHITQAITQPKIAKNAQITQKNTSFKAHFLTFWGPNDWFLKHFRKKLFLLLLFQPRRTKNFRTCDLILRNFSVFWGKFLVFMPLRQGQILWSPKSEKVQKRPKSHLFCVTITKKSQRSTQYYKLHITHVHYTPSLGIPEWWS